MHKFNQNKMEEEWYDDMYLKKKIEEKDYYFYKIILNN